MDLKAARDIVEKIWPGEGVTLQVKGQLHEVVAKDGSVLGRAFSWQPALQQAAKPKLDAAAADEATRREAMQQEFVLFQEFLREYLAPKFLEWKAARAAAKPEGDAGNAGGSQPHPVKLVQLVR